MSDLHLAAYQGDSERVGRCLRAGMDVNARDEYNYTPLHWTVDMGMAPGDRENIVAMLIRTGADVDSIDGLGRSVLELASLAGNEDIIRQLMRAGGRCGQSPSPKTLERRFAPNPARSRLHNSSDTPPERRLPVVSKKLPP